MKIFNFLKPKAKEKRKENLEDKKRWIREIREPCGHRGVYDLSSFVPLHRYKWIEDNVETPRGFVKRTFCPICMTYWEEKYKKVKGGKEEKWKTKTDQV